MQVYSTAVPSAPPHPAAQSLYPHIDAPSPFLGYPTDSPRNNGSSYFSSAASASTGQPPVHPPQPTNGMAMPTQPPAKPAPSPTQPSRSPLRSASPPEFDVTVSAPTVVTEPSPIAVPGTSHCLQTDKSTTPRSIAQALRSFQPTKATVKLIVTMLMCWFSSGLHYLYL